LRHAGGRRRAACEGARSSRMVAVLH
jgi:hypothetical protein